MNGERVRKKKRNSNHVEITVESIELESDFFLVDFVFYSEF